MQSSVAKWGNSLAVRIPKEYARATGLKEGAVLELSVSPAGELRLAPAQAFDKSRFLKDLATLQRRMPESPAVVPALRSAARY